MPAWPWRVGLIVESPELAFEITNALRDINAALSFRAQPSAEPFDIATQVERQKPDLLFVELARVPGSAESWIKRIRSGGDTLIAAVHNSADPVEMIEALRAGACEFLHLPVQPSIFDAMDRIATIFEGRRSEVVERGFVSGFLSAKGGCGATTIACHVAAAGSVAGSRRVLVADLDHQAPGAHRLFHTSPTRFTGDAFLSARRLSSANWHDFVVPVGEQLDLLAGSDSSTSVSPDAWRIDNLFRFVTRHYGRVVADLGRNLNPCNWAYLQTLDELIIVTAPDVLALYQTRQILQTLTSRGFEKSRVRLILNRNHMAPEDFWVESIEQMFEMAVLDVIPNDYASLNDGKRDRYEFPTGTAFGRAMSRLAGKLVHKSADTTRPQ